MRIEANIELFVPEESFGPKPKMEYFFDEITEAREVICPFTNETVRIVCEKRACLGGSGYHDVISCPYFKGALPRCGKGCLKQLAT